MVKIFTPEYKKQCVEILLDGKHSISQVCKMMRVSQSALNRWRQKFLAEQQGITPKNRDFCRTVGNSTFTGGK